MAECQLVICGSHLARNSSEDGVTPPSADATDALLLALIPSPSVKTEATILNITKLNIPHPSLQNQVSFNRTWNRETQVQISAQS